MAHFFSLVKELKPSTTLWAMRLRLIISFDVPAYNNRNEVASFEFIFQDKEILVKELKPSTTLWAMRLRLIRSFDVLAYNNRNEVASFEFIFQDKEGDRVHA
ncbi:hypothetical protein OROGR_001527 [Orobanche gracilis]